MVMGVWKGVARRAQVLVALAVGCGFGSAVTGCALVFLGVARADGSSGPTPGSIITVPCGTDGYAVQEFPGSSKYDLATSVYVINSPDRGVMPRTVGTTTYHLDVGLGPSPVAMGGNIPMITDGEVAVACAAGTSVQLYVRP